MDFMQRAPFRYSTAIGAVVVAYLLRDGITRLVGGDLPPFITFYPAIMFVALLAGLGPGLLATAMAALLADYYIHPPQGFGTERLRDAVGLLLFSSMGVFMSLVAELYRRARNRLEEMVDERTAALTRTNEQLTLEIGERREAEEALCMERDFNTAVLDTVGALVVILDREGRIMRFNTACEEVAGYTEAEVRGRVLWEFLILRDELPGVRQAWDSLRTGDFPNRHENCWLAKDGSRRLIAWSNTAIVGPQGEIDYIIGTGVDITEQKQAKDALRESEEFLNRAQAISHLGSWVLDLASNRLFWSDEAYRIFGLRPQEFGATYDAFLEAVHPDDRSAVDAAYSGSLRDGRDTYEIEHRVVRKSDGQVRVVHEKCEHFRDASGRIVRSVGMVHDITERKRAEESLHESEQKLQLFIEHAPAAIAMFDRSMRYIAASRRWITDYHLAGQEIVGRSHYDIFPEIPGHWKEVHKRCLAGATEKCDEEAFPRVDGTTDWIRWEVLPWYEIGGEIGGIIISSEDISRRKQAEEARRESEALFSTVYHASPVGIGITRLADGKFVDVNDAFLAIYGYAREGVIGHTSTELGMWLPEERDSLIGEMKKLGRVQNVEMTFRKKSGEIGAELVSVELIDLRGEKCILGLLTDITDRKRHEEELIEARRAAEAASRAKSQFLANMSHELRTPMTGVLGMLDLTLDGELARNQREYLETVQTSAKALLRLLNDILDFSRIEAGAIAFAEEPYNLEWCVSSAVELLAVEAQRKGLELAVEIAPGTPGVVVGDEGRVRQVLVNLVGNAVKFTDQGKVAVHVREGGQTADGRREILFAVTDSGIGIPADKKELLFQSFSQVDGSSTRRHGGTGLGLAISKRIVERMGGAIAFASEEGTGSIFTFSIPHGETKAAAAADLPAGAAEEAECSAASPAAPITARLLVVEDDPVIRDLLERSLRNQGYDLDVAGNGQEAVALWERGEYALVIMDVQMPRMDGFEATRLIRQKERERGGHTPIVAVTAHAYSEDEARCLAAGMDAYLAKPIDFEKMYELLADFTPPSQSTKKHA